MTIKNDEWQRISANLDKKFSKMSERYTFLSDAYHQRMDLGKMRKNIVKYNPPTANSIVDAATAYISSLGKKVEVPSYNNNEEDKKFLSTIANICEHTIQWMERSHKVNMIHSVIKDMFLYGAGCWKGPVYIPKIKPKAMSDEAWAEQQKRTFPFHFHVVNPFNIKWWPLDDPEYVKETTLRTVSSIKKEHPKFQTKLDNFDDIEYEEIWTNDDKQFFAGGEPLFADDENDELLGVPKTTNLFGFKPYKIGLSGMGASSPKGKVEEQIVGILQPLLSALKTEARIMTTYRFGTEQNIFGLKIANNMLPDNSIFPDEPMQLGMIPGYNEEYKIFDIAPTHSTDDVFKLMSIIDNHIDSVIPRAIRGNVFPYQSGYANAITTGNTVTKFDQVKLAIENMLALSLEEIFVITEKFEETIGLFGDVSDKERGYITIPHNRINSKMLRIYTKLDAESPEQRNNRFMLGIYLLRAGLPWETVCKDFWGYNPVDQIKLKLKEAVLNNPMVIQDLASLTVGAAGFGSTMDLIKQGKVVFPVTGPQGFAGQGATESGLPWQQPTRQRYTPGAGPMNTPPEQGGYNGPPT